MWVGCITFSPFSPYQWKRMSGFPVLPPQSPPRPPPERMMHADAYTTPKNQPRACVLPASLTACHMDFQWQGYVYGPAHNERVVNCLVFSLQTFLPDSRFTRAVAVSLKRSVEENSRWRVVLLCSLKSSRSRTAFSIYIYCTFCSSAVHLLSSLIQLRATRRYGITAHYLGFNHFGFPTT